MFSKKKPVAAMPRSRFVKAKPNIKIGPKSSQPNEKKQDKSSTLDEKRCEPSVDQKVVEKISDANESNSSNKIDEDLVSLQTNGVEDTCDNTARNESHYVTIYHEPLVAECPPSKERESESSFQQSESISSDERSVDCIPSENSVRKSVCVESTENSAVGSSPVKNTEIIPDKHIPYEPPKIVQSKEVHNKIADTPEKSAVGTTSIKAIGGTAVDKSSKYPCITKILAGPKKRSQNKEINERKKKMASFKELPPRNEMTFTDLIYYKPRSAPMKSKEAKPSLLFDPKDSTAAEEEEEVEEEGENASVAPKLFVNENGEIIIDESSLVVKRKKAAVDMTAAAIIMDDNNITYGTFRRKVSKPWSPKETVNFYKALSVVGTDFALMENIMPNRTRRELKIKFKKEEKINMELLHRAMYETETFQTDLSVEDLNLDVIDIPGLEEHVAKDSTGPNGRKQVKRKRKDQVLSEIATNDVAIENGQSLPVKKARGRTKKKVDRTSSVDSPDSDSELLEIVHGNIFDEQNQSSPLVRKRRVKVLSQDSVENNDQVTDELCEIEVHINSLPTEEESETASHILKDMPSDFLHSPTPANDESWSGRKGRGRPKKICDSDNEWLPTDHEDMNMGSSINPEESPTNNTAQSVSSCIKLEKQPFPEIVISAVHNHTSSKREQTPEPSITADITNGVNVVKDKVTDELLLPGSATIVEASDLENEPTRATTKKPLQVESSTSQAATYKRARRLKIKPNVKAPKINNSEVQIKETVAETQVDIIPFSASHESLSVIDVTDDKLLSDGVTDVVTTTARVHRKSKAKPNIPAIRHESSHNSPNTVRWLQPSSLNYTPVLEPEFEETVPSRELKCNQRTSKKDLSSSETCNSLRHLISDEPKFTKKLGLRTYSRRKAAESSKKIESPLGAIQVPVITPERAAKLNDLMSSPYVTSLNMSSKEPISIPITPDRTDLSDHAGLMLMAQSPDGNSLHFYVANNFPGGMPMPSQIPAPPIAISMEYEKS